MNVAPIILVTLLASVAASALLVAAIALVARNRSLDARARHVLWFGALIVIAALPIAGIATSVATAVRQAPSRQLDRPSRVVEPIRIPPALQRASAAARAQRSPAAIAEPRWDWAIGALRALRDHALDAAAGIATFLLVAVGVGTLIGLLTLAVSLARLAAVKRRSSPLDQRLAGELPWLTSPGGRESYLRLSYEIETPVAIGFGRPVILIPTELATQSGLHAIEDLVVHEHAHIERYDDYTNLAQRVIERLLWFNPFVWVVGRRLALEREIAADDSVVARTADSARYAASLWQLAREMRMPTHSLVAPGALFTRKQISVRIEALMAPGRSRLHGLGPLTSAGALIVALVCVGIVAFAAPPLELPGATAGTAQTVAWAPATHHQERSDQELAALNELSSLIAHRLASLHDEAGALGPNPSPQRVSDMASTTNLLGAKLETMKALAQTIRASAMQRRIEALQTQQAHLSASLRVLADRVAATPQPSETVALPGPVEPMPPVSVAPQPASAPKKAASGTPRTKAGGAWTDAVTASTVNDAMAVARHALNAAGGAEKIVAANGDGDASGPALSRALIAHCTGCDLSGRDLRNIDLHGITITGADMRKTDLRGANLAGTQFSGTDLTEANLDGANLIGARFVGADIGGATFRGAKMDGVQFVGISLRRSALDPGGIRAILLRGCEGCDLSHMDLRGVDFHGITLTGADLSHSDLTGADLSGARFTGVDFNGAHLDRVNFRGASLQGCSLANASLNGAQLEGISLVGTSLNIDR